MPATGEIYGGKYGAFRTGRRLLLSFYVSYPQISGSADSPDYQGEPSWPPERKANGTL